MKNVKHCIENAAGEVTFEIFMKKKMMTIIILQTNIYWCGEAIENDEEQFEKYIYLHDEKKIYIEHSQINDQIINDVAKYFSTIALN